MESDELTKKLEIIKQAKQQLTDAYTKMMDVSSNNVLEDWIDENDII